MTDERSHVSLIYDSLGGRPVLLPVEPGTKEPYGTKWLSVTFDDTQSPDYRRDLEGECSIGVLLGPPSRAKSHGEEYLLAAVNVDSLEAAVEWETLNPKTALRTLQTDTPRGRIYWFWIMADTLPDSGDVYPSGPDGAAIDPDTPRWGSLLAMGTHAMVYGTHPCGEDYETDFSRTVFKCEFDELAWPEGHTLPWAVREDSEEYLVETYGQPWYFSANGALQINQPYWPASYAAVNRVLYEPDEGRFYQYLPDRGLWKEQTDASVANRLSGFMMERADGDSRVIVKRTKSLMEALAGLLKGQVERREPFIKEPGRIHVKNGMLNIRSNPMAKTGFSPGHYSRNQIPYAYDPEADCPRFKRELLQSALDEPLDIDLLQRWAGMCLLGINLGQKILMLTGTGGAGKSTFIKAIAAMIGQENVVALRTHLLAERFEIANFVGKTLLVGADVPGNFLMTEGAFMLKSLVGGDALTAETKNVGRTKTVYGDFNVGINSNSRLKVSLSGDAGAWERRLMLVPYTLPPPEKPDPHFLQKLLAEEASGILNWMVQGAVALYKDFEESGKFRMHKVQRARIDDLLAESDSIRHFVKTCLAVEERVEPVLKEEIQTAYVRFCEAKGWTAVGGNTMKSGLTDRILEIHRKTESNGIKKHDEKARRGYYGLRILEWE